MFLFLLHDEEMYTKFMPHMQCDYCYSTSTSQNVRKNTRDERAAGFLEHFFALLCKRTAKEKKTIVVLTTTMD